MIRAWIARHIIADEPRPEYSRLDRMDGLGTWTTTPAGGLINQPAFDQMAHRLFGEAA